jgi:hypothetical protein
MQFQCMESGLFLQVACFLRVVGCLGFKFAAAAEFGQRVVYIGATSMPWERPHSCRQDAGGPRRADPGTPASLLADVGGGPRPGAPGGGDQVTILGCVTGEGDEHLMLKVCAIFRNANGFSRRGMDSRCTDIAHSSAPSEEAARRYRLNIKALASSSQFTTDR